MTEGSTCHAGMTNSVAGSATLRAPHHRALDKGLRTAGLIRFVGREDGLLSLTHDGPRMFINIEGGR